MKKPALHTDQLVKLNCRAAPAGHGSIVLGIDVGGTHTKMAAFGLGGELLGSCAFDSRRVVAAGSRERFAHEVGAMLERVGAGAGRVAAVGLAVPGAVSEGGSLELCPNIDLDLEACRSLLCAQFPQAILEVLNDADAAVLGDCWRGSASEHAGGNVALVTLGTGVGAGFVFQGALYGSSHGAAGEVGHLCVDPHEQEPCSCGRTGCLEQYASAKGLVRAARREHAARASRREHAARTAAPSARAAEAGGWPTSPSAFAADAARAAAEAFPDARSVLEARERRDPAALAALECFSKALGFGLSQMACIVDPDVLVLGGGLSERADLFLDAVRARYRACALPPCRDTPIVASKLGNACGVHGAAFRALDALARSGRPGACGCRR